MIHDAVFPVTCDGPHCLVEELVDGFWLVGGYDCTDREVERAGFFVEDGLHFCSEECMEDYKNDN